LRASLAFVNVRAALRPSDFLFLHFRFARDRRLFKKPCRLRTILLRPQTSA
jgi:hypothetical protein